MPRNAPAMTIDSLKAVLLDESLKMPDLDDEYFEQAQNDDGYESLITAMFHEGGLSKARAMTGPRSTLTTRTLRWAASSSPTAEPRMR